MGYPLPCAVVLVRVLSVLLLVLVPSGVWAQSTVAERKNARAVRVEPDTIRVDGRLDEAIWREIPAIADFVQREPVEGAPATDRTEVRFAYDDGALYVGARMYSNGPIQAPLGRRDEGDQAEHIHVSLDTYLDRRTAATFGVTASGVRIDFFHASDDFFQDDDTFNPVWEARTAVLDDGWTAELWIPLSQLRFNASEQQVWGLNVRRWVPTRNEEVFWAPMLRTERRWASGFGNLTGLEGLRPRRRLELLPYVASDGRIAGDRDRSNPFSETVDLSGRIGGDVKIGFGSNLTLEATVNPDFGQVEADPAEVNLSAFETFFDERRPFFVEGANLLTGNINNYFYSRRIGASPTGPADGEYVDYPGTTTIIGAAKLTGRLSSGTSLGLLGALTDNESARVFDGNVIERVRVAPRTAYGVARVQQEVGAPGSTVALMATAVHRQFDPGDVLASRLTRNALTVSGDSVLRFGDHELQSYFGVTHVNGEAAAIARLQRSSARYFQRPDVDYVRFDPTRTSMWGSKGGVLFQRQNARHWVYEIEAAYESPEFETNDIGRLTTGDGKQIRAQLEYQQTTPGSWYREWDVTMITQQEWNYGGDRQTSLVTNVLEVTLPNYVEAELETTYDFRRQDMRLTRGGPSMERPAGWQSTLTIETSEAQQTRGTLSAVYGRNDEGGLIYSTEAGITMRPGPQWELSVTPKYEREVDPQQYVATLDGGTAATYGSRYIFGHIDRSTYSAQVRLNYTFKPDLNLDFYAEPFAASGQYDRLGELLAARGRQLRALDPATLDLDEDLAFNVRSFRSNLVLRWEWRPGSTFYVVWQQDREDDLFRRRRSGISDLFRSFGAAGDNFLAVKASFWISR